MLQLSGTVADAAGKPLPEAEIARYYMLDHGKLVAQGMMKANAQGRFSWLVQRDQLPVTYIVMDRNHELGCCVTLSEKAMKSPVSLVLKPLAEVSFTPVVEGGFGPVSMTTSIGYPDARAIVVQSQDHGPYRIPEGKYELSIRSPDLEYFRKPFTARAGKKLDLGASTVMLSPVARNFGKPALPIDFAEARGVPAGFKLHDLKGKWVLLEFWGFW